jgi:uncharacterized protein (DUF2126 family)
VYLQVSYLIRMEVGVQTCEETLAKKSGSCRDSAWLLVQILRHLGIAARFVSGYLIQLTADEKPLDGAAGPDVDFTDLHAWCEAYIPGAGWVGLDATSGLLTGEGHIPLAVSATPTSAAPITGMTSICESNLDVEMYVTRMFEDPRVTKPFNEMEWQKIRSLGLFVDAELQAGDVRLTQGGEPTFVSVDNMDGAEWNIEALGQQKWELANVLMKKMQDEFTSGEVTHFGQGKWYPGEPLPRWALNVFWRVDKMPIWRDKDLIGNTSTEIPASMMQRFSVQLVQRLGLNSSYGMPAYEDPWIAINEESRLPGNIDPHKHDLKRPDIRNNLAKQLRDGVTSVTAYVLPLKAVGGTNVSWESSAWPLRHDRLYLLSGDSPAGLRLPLGSLPWVMPDDVEREPERDPFEKRSTLSDFPLHKSSAYPLPKPYNNKPKSREVIHTALVLEIRDGFLYVFMPPLMYLESWLELVAAIESCAQKLNQPVRLEGYPPPRDSRMLSFSVTPDPGVIEVNIHPLQVGKFSNNARKNCMKWRVQPVCVQPKNSCSMVATQEQAVEITLH